MFNGSGTLLHLILDARDKLSARETQRFGVYFEFLPNSVTDHSLRDSGDE